MNLVQRTIVHHDHLVSPHKNIFFKKIQDIIKKCLSVSLLILYGKPFLSEEWMGGWEGRVGQEEEREWELR